MENQLQAYTTPTAELEQLRNDYQSLVVTRDNLKEANSARLKLKNARLAIQRVENKNKDILNELKKKSTSEAQALIGIIKPVEDRIDTDITVIENQIEKERKEKEEAERRRREELYECSRFAIKSQQRLIGEVLTSNDREWLQGIMASRGWPACYNGGLDEKLTSDHEFYAAGEQHLEQSIKTRLEALDAFDARCASAVSAMVETVNYCINSGNAAAMMEAFNSAMPEFLKGTEFEHDWKREHKRLEDHMKEFAAPETAESLGTTFLSNPEVTAPAEDSAPVPTAPAEDEVYFPPAGSGIPTRPAFGEVSKSMGVDTKPAHRLEHKGYWMLCCPEMSPELFELCAAAVKEVLDREVL